ncbi:MAG: uracil-DNA glycosylase family protein [Trueperella sp.]|nr:uracil-DNA glycosylase family protein [Trueperella sp.]
MPEIAQILQEIKADPDNAEFTAQGWEPVLQVSPQAQILIIGQAPGAATQAAGEVFRDKSGDQLRAWLGVDTETFYGSGAVAVLPMDFYFPGKGKSGDLAPRPQIAEKYHPRLLAAMPQVKLILLIGQYSQRHYLGDRRKKNLTETVRHYAEYAPYFPLVHPSPRNNIWQKKNPWFATEVVPDLQKRVQEIMGAVH